MSVRAVRVCVCVRPGGRLWTRLKVPEGRGTTRLSPSLPSPHLSPHLTCLPDPPSPHLVHHLPAPFLTFCFDHLRSLHLCNHHLLTCLLTLTCLSSPHLDHHYYSPPAFPQLTVLSDLYLLPSPALTIWLPSPLNLFIVPISICPPVLLFFPTCIPITTHLPTT